MSMAAWLHSSERPEVRGEQNHRSVECHGMVAFFLLLTAPIETSLAASPHGMVKADLPALEQPLSSSTWRRRCKAHYFPPPLKQTQKPHSSHRAAAEVLRGWQAGEINSTPRGK